MMVNVQRQQRAREGEIENSGEREMYVPSQAVRNRLVGAPVNGPLTPDVFHET